MEITNKYNLPTVFLQALTGNMESKVTEVKPDYRVTMLCSPPKIACLKKRYGHLVKYDAYDLFHSMLGDSIHNYIQNGLKNNDRYLAEETILKDIDGKLVSGTLDCYDKETKTLIDHKTTSTYVYSSPLKPEWVEQTNIYAYLLEELGHEVKEIKIHIIFKDWRENAGRYSGALEYPPTPIMLLDVPLMSKEERKELFTSRLQELIKLEEVKDEDLPDCTPEQMWEKPVTFAVYKRGASRATKLCPTHKDAEDYIKYKGQYGKDLLIEHRQGARTRCEKYCDIAPYCKQYQEWVKQRDEETAQAVEDNMKTVVGE